MVDFLLIFHQVNTVNSAVLYFKAPSFAPKQISFNSDFELENLNSILRKFKVTMGHLHIIIPPRRKDKCRKISYSPGTDNISS